MQVFAVVSSDIEPHHLHEFRHWCLMEWGELDPFTGPDADLKIPSPLLAVQGQQLIGGLAFTSHPTPGGYGSGLWINALIVAPAYRNNRVGSRLIMAAEVEAGRFGAKDLFVYSGN